MSLTAIGERWRRSLRIHVDSSQRSGSVDLCRPDLAFRGREEDMHAWSRYCDEERARRSLAEESAGRTQDFLHQEQHKIPMFFYRQDGKFQLRAVQKDGGETVGAIL